MGDRQNQMFQLSFNALLKPAFENSRVNSDGDHRTKHTQTAGPHFHS
jgi:hypothetical protein